MSDFKKRSSEIFQLVADDNLPRAIRRLLDFIRDFADESELQTDAIVVSANHKKFVREERMDLIEKSAISHIRSKIINQILEVLKEACSYVKDKFVAAPEVKQPVRTQPIATPPVVIQPPVTSSQAESVIENKVETPPPVADSNADISLQGILAPNPKINPLVTPDITQQPASTVPQGIATITEQGSDISTHADQICYIKDLKKRYKKSRFTLENINIELEKNEILGVVGENGNGKTTFFKILTGELRHDSGEIRFPAFNENNPKKINWINVKHNLAYVEQELPKWYGSLKDNLHYEASCQNVNGRVNKKEVEFMLHRLGLIEHIDKKWNQLSGGYKLRFSLAKALLKKPKILVLDEPLANLDINAQALVVNDLRDLANSIKYPVSIVFSSQHLHEVEYISDKILFIQNGHPIFYGKKGDLGNDRRYNYYEIQTELNKEELIEKLENLKIVDVIYESMYVQLVTPLDVTPDKVIAELLKQKVSLSYFRDISKSTKKLFV